MKRSAMICCILMVAAFLCCSACRRQEQAATSGRLRVVTTLFPLYDFARQIGGDRVDVSLLMPPGLEPHSFEPKPEDMVRVSGAGLFVYTSDVMEPWVAGVLKGLTGQRKPDVVLASEGVTLMKEPDADGGEDHHTEDHDHHVAGAGHHHAGGLDPHVWLDFDNARRMVDTIAAGMARRDPAGRDQYLANVDAYKRKLAALDERYRTGLASCRTRTFIHGGHYAFGYLAHRYNLHYIAANALSTDAEPTPRRMMELTRQVRENNLSYLFYGELVSPRVAETIGRETGARLLQLNAAHNVSRDELARGVTFLSLMEQNLEQLRTGLQCR